MTDRNDSETNTQPEQPSRRRALKVAGAAGTAALISAPFIRNAAAAETTVWKIQTSWPAGVGLQTFKTWCAGIKEKTGGELEFKPFAAKEVVGDFELLDGVKNGVLEAMNSFTLYWAGKLPSTAFLSSYLMGLRYPHEWDIFFYSKGGLQMARDLFAKQGLYYVNRIHHGPNIIHSKKPIRTIEDFKDLQPACSGRHDRRRFRGRWGQNDPASGAAKYSRHWKRERSTQPTTPALPSTGILDSSKSASTSGPGLQDWSRSINPST